MASIAPAETFRPKQKGNLSSLPGASFVQSVSETAKEENGYEPLWFLKGHTKALLFDINFKETSIDGEFYEKNRRNVWGDEYALPRISQHMGHRLLYQPFSDLYDYVYDEQVDDAEDEIQDAVERSAGEQVRQIEMVRDLEHWTRYFREKHLTVKYERDEFLEEQDSVQKTIYNSARRLYFKLQPDLRSMKPCLRGETNQIPWHLFDHSVLHIYADEFEWILFKEIKNDWFLETSMEYDGRASASVSLRNSHYLFVLRQDVDTHLEFRYILNPSLYEPLFRWLE